MQTPFARGGCAALPDKEKPEETVGAEAKTEKENGKEDKGQGRDSSNLSEWDLAVSFLAASSPLLSSAAPASKEGEGLGWVRWVKSNEGWVAI